SPPVSYIGLSTAWPSVRPGRSRLQGWRSGWRRRGPLPAGSEEGGGRALGGVPMKILIGSVISITPFSPGMAWNWMHHAVGFQKLGHEVYYLEEVEPRWSVDSRGQPCRFED